MTLNDKQFVGHKISGNRSVNLNKDVYEKPIKKCHFLEGKFFVVIDKSIIDKLGISDEIDTYFYQEIDEEGALVLRPFKREYNKDV